MHRTKVNFITPGTETQAERDTGVDKLTRAKAARSAHTIYNGCVLGKARESGMASLWPAGVPGSPGVPGAPFPGEPGAPGGPGVKPPLPEGPVAPAQRPQ